ncbi:ogr/Delta-like zinc finger family protein [Ralstonia pseudosolanacearum]|uniref:ogr/Delta-like zinc finger family protein n=1 Tax=Ralstonia pseudosolanacearum TaxID=1310165 RepID=UPI001FF75531|nr:ogr/Delta-like zinc finger family protein [Ralstonia pseudosolanacearum]
MKVTCPHCDSVASIRTSRAVSRVTRELYCQCTNLLCGHTFVSLLEAVRTLAPSNTPNPLVDQQLQRQNAEQPATVAR